MTEDFKEYMVLGPLSKREVKPVRKYAICQTCRTLYYNDLLSYDSLYCPEGCGTALYRLEAFDEQAADLVYQEYETRKDY